MDELKKIKKELEEELNKKDIIVDSVVFEVKNNYNFLTVTLDKFEGIDLDTIVLYTPLVNKIVDKYDMSFGNYILDVVSKERNEDNERK